jgi:hypothetical protein
MMFWFGRHRRLRDRLSAYIDRGLDPAATRRLEAHLGECARCRAELEQLRSTVAALRELPEARVPRSFALSPERASALRPSMAAAPLAFGARIAAAGVAAALAAVLVVDLGDLGGDGGAPGVAPDGMLAERQADDGKVNGEDGATAIPGAPTMMDESPAAGYGLEAEGDAAAGAGAPELEDAAPREPTDAPAAGPDAAGEDAEGEFMRDSGAAETPAAGPEEGEVPVAASSGDGGIDALTVAEIGLAASLGVLVGGSFVLAFVGRKR